jgi:hypothetical protein
VTPRTTLATIAIFAAATAPAHGQEVCGPETAGLDGTTFQACTSPLDPADINCDRLPHNAQQPNGDRHITLTICPDPRLEQLRAQLRVERARHANTIRRLTTTNRQLRAAAARTWRPSVDHAIHLAAKAYGVDHAAMRRVAHCESTMRPWATNGQYVGLFQTGTAFWSNTPFSAFPRTDPYANALATAHVVAHQGWRQWECKP